MSEPRCTLTTTARHEQTIRKSRFVAQAAPVASEGEALAFLESASEATANHNCWAWRLGQACRFNDDGEPGSSAGKPILTAIDGQDMDRVMLVVSRWFGGTKLGIGGLIRAYGGTAAECLRLAPRRKIIDMAVVRFHLGYAEMELLRARTQAWTTEVLGEDYRSDGVALTLKVARTRIAELQSLLANLSQGRCRLEQLP